MICKVKKTTQSPLVLLLCLSHTVTLHTALQACEPQGREAGSQQPRAPLRWTANIFKFSAWNTDGLHKILHL